jgi:stage II sporulation protein D
MARKSLKTLVAAGTCGVLLVALPGLASAATSSKRGGTFQIKGAGFGHGIGMSQYGALGYALHGWNYQGILDHYYAGTSLGKVANSTVTVLLEDGAAVFRGATSADGQKLSASRTYGVVPDGSKLEVISAGSKVGVFSAPLTVAGSDLDVSSKGHYAGALKFYPDGSGVITVNAVDLEDYVKGVIAEEMPASWPEPALEAQAVAARTYVLASHPVNPDYDVYDDTRSQMYGGISGEASSSDLAEATTRGQVVEQAGQLIPTYFFSSSGGHTESIQNVWLGTTPEPFLVGVSDPYDSAGHNPYYRWSDTLSLATAGRRLAGLYEGTLEGIKILTHGTSPRIVSARVVGTRGGSTVSGETLQEDLGTMSTWMSFTSITAKGNLTSGSGAGPASGSSRGSGSGSASGSGGSGSPSTGSGTTGGAGIGGAAVRLHERSVSGTVFSAGRGGNVTIERLVNHRWVLVGRARVSAAGAYTMRVVHAGTFRAVYAGAVAPAVTVA